jgi:hypothetical protein
MGRKVEERPSVKLLIMQFRTNDSTGDEKESYWDYFENRTNSICNGIG